MSHITDTSFDAFLPSDILLLVPSTLPGRWWLNEEINEQVERYRNELYNLKRKWPPEFAEFQECNYCTFVIDELLRIAPYYMYGYFLVLNAYVFCHHPVPCLLC